MSITDIARDMVAHYEKHGKDTAEMRMLFGRLQKAVHAPEAKPKPKPKPKPTYSSTSSISGTSNY